MAQFTLDGVTYSRFRDIPGAVYTRSGVEYQQNAAGVWTPFDDDVPPISSGVGVDVWQGATNLLLRSQDLSNAAWAKISSATVALVAGAPDGSSTFARVTGGGIPSSRIQQAVGGVSAGTIYSGSVFLAYDSAPSSRVAVFDGSVGTQIAAVAINWTADVPSIGTINGTFAVAPALTQVGSTGTWRITYGVNTGAFTSLAVLLYPDYTNGTAATKFWGPQLEVGSIVTPLVPTTNAAATRGAPSMYINAPGLIVPSLGVTVVVDVTWPRTLTTTGMFVEPFNAGGGTATGFSLSSTGDGTRPRVIARQGSVRIDTSTNGPIMTRGQRAKLGITFDGSTAAYASALGATINSGFVPPQSDYAGEPIHLGQRSGSSLFMNGAINSVTFLRGLRTQAELNALTA